MRSGESLDFENEKYMVQAGPSLLALMSCCSCLGVSVHSNESPMFFPGGTTLPQNQINDADSHLPHHQLIRRISRSWSCPLWTITIKLFHVGTHSFEAIRLLCPRLPDKAIKLFFHTSSKTLSLRFNSISGYRGQIQLHVWPSTSLKLSKRFSHHLNSLYCMPSSLHPASPSHYQTQPQGIPLEPTDPKPPEKAGHLPPLMPSKRSTEKPGDRLAHFEWLATLWEGIMRNSCRSYISSQNQTSVLNCKRRNHQHLVAGNPSLFHLQICLMMSEIRVWWGLCFCLLWLCWVFTAACRLSLAAVSGGFSLLVVCRLLIVLTSLVVDLGLQMCRLQ